MEKISRRWGASPLLALALLIVLLAACGKKNETAATSSPTPSPAFATATAAPPITGPVSPAIVTQDASSITHYLHFPKAAATAQVGSVVQFYCDVDTNGAVEATYGLVGNNDSFKAAVQTALDWGRFAPATIDKKPVAVYLGGTVFFFHQNGTPVIAVSLATEDRERVGKLANYIQPQLVGGLRSQIEKVIRQLPRGFPVGGRAEAVVKVDERGAVTSTSLRAESPKEGGLGALLEKAIQGAQYTHAFQDGKPAAGTVNVVADFSEL